MDNAKVVILGNTGFVGLALTKLLQARGIPFEGYNSSQLDLTKQECTHKLGKILNKETTLIVATRIRRKKNDDQYDLLTKEILMYTNLGKCLSQRAIKKCIYLSSASVYDSSRTNMDITEQTPIDPTSFYGLAKFTGENILRQVSNRVDIPLVIFRSCKIYGPGDINLEYGPVSFVISTVQKNQIRLFGDGQEKRSFLFIKDLVEIIERFLLNNITGTFNLASGPSVSFYQIVKLLEDIVSQDIKMIYESRNNPPIDQCINYSNLKSMIPDFRSTDLSKGLTETYQHYSTQS